MNKNRLLILVKGELQRLNKYGVTSISVLVAFIWGLLLFFLNTDLFDAMLPFIVLLDASLMSFMYIGSVMFFEKSESTISTMLVTPVSNSELMLSKVIANTVHNLLSSLLIIIVFIILKDIEVHYVLIIVGITLVTAVFTVIGLVLSYFQKDFTDLLVNIMLLSFALFLPTALYTFGVLKGEAWEYILMINPIQAAGDLINAGFHGIETVWKYIFSFLYLFVGGILLYKYYALPKFQDYAVKQSGV